MKTNIEKIEKQINSLDAKIKALCGDYLTNTRKRQLEQKYRDEKKEKLREQMQVLQFIREESLSRELSRFEAALITGAFYEETRNLLSRRQYQNSRNSHTAYPLSYERCHAVTQSRLNKAGITSTSQLLAAIDEFETLLTNAVIKPDPNVKRIRDLTFEARNNQRGDVQFTPAPIVRQLIGFAGLNENCKVLEPEAGIGYIADEVKKITPNVDCIELCPSFEELLKLKGHTVIGSNLYDCEQTPQYDAVLMNPPFSDECGHIKYAFGFLKPGGTLVSVCCARIQNSDKKSYREFRNWLNQHEHYFDKASGQFEMTGTQSVILTINNKEVA